MREEHGVRHVGLEADASAAGPPFRAIRTLRRQLCMPAQQISPSAASRSPKSLGDGRRPRGRSAAIRLVLAAGILGPLGRRWRPNRCGRCRTGGCPRSRSLLPMRQAFSHLRQEAAALGFVAHRGSAAGRRPDGRDQRAGAQTFAMQACRRAASDRRRRNRYRCAAARGTDRRHRSARHRRGGGGQVEHRIEIDGRLGIGAFADQSRPHGVVEGREGVRSGSVHWFPPRREPPTDSGLKRLKLC